MTAQHTLCAKYWFYRPFKFFNFAYPHSYKHVCQAVFRPTTFDLNPKIESTKWASHDSCPSPAHFGHPAPVPCCFSIQPPDVPWLLTPTCTPVHNSQSPDLPHLPTHLFPFPSSAPLCIYQLGFPHLLASSLRSSGFSCWLRLVLFYLPVTCLCSACLPGLFKPAHFCV